MAKKNDKQTASLDVSGDLTSRRLSPTIRPLTDQEVKALKDALGKPVDRDFLTSRITRTISDIVRLSTQPTPRKYRDHLLALAREGREWLQHIERCSSTMALRPYGDLAKLTTAVTEFCDRVHAGAEQVDASIKAGHPQTSYLFEVFVKNMIGIAKWAHVRPSMPSRTISPKQAPPAFFSFLTETIAIARDVIGTSTLPPGQKRAALSIFRVQSRQALIKFVEKQRGRIQDYRDGAHGLVVWEQKDV